LINKEHSMTCPKCYSKNVHAISNIHTNKDNDFCKGFLCGSLCFPCDLCSMISGKVTTTILWICDDCGRKFKY